jgi:hypothetical protein
VRVIRDTSPIHGIPSKNGDEPIDASCGSAILDEQGRVVGFFQFKMNDAGECYGASAAELRGYGYETRGGEQTF